MFDEVYLTGFKKFGNCSVNPTQMIAEHYLKSTIAGLHSAVVEVTTKDVDAYINSMKKIIADMGTKKILNLHFGVGPNKIYHLERCCYNNKDFGIPDNLGYQPKNEQICKDTDLDCPINCKLDLLAIENKLGKKHQLQQSDDPGRYLCNYIYFQSSHELSLKNENVCSLFVHFPDLKISSH